MQRTVRTGYLCYYTIDRTKVADVRWEWGNLRLLDVHFRVAAPPECIVRTLDDDASRRNERSSRAEIGAAFLNGEKTNSVLFLSNHKLHRILYHFFYK